MESGYYQPQSSENKPREVRTGSSKNYIKNFFDLVMRVRRRARRVPLVLTLIMLTSFFQAGQSVWSLSVPHQVYFVGFVNQFCDGMGLTREQSLLCAEKRELMVGVRYGANLATKQCQYQFQYRRWNCSVPERDANTLFRRITEKGTREAAFTYAISAAGVVYSLARQCAESNLSACGCSRERRPKEIDKMIREQGRDEDNNPVEFQWGGCGDNIEFGTNFAKEFLNEAGEDMTSTETREHEKALMNVHNNLVGIQIVNEAAKIQCKCHGISGSCNVKTCQRVLPEFLEIGDTLHEKYDNAVLVKLERKNTVKILHIKKKKSGDFRRDSSSNRRSSRPANNTLVFLKESPKDYYCTASRDFPGTVGRFCNVDSYGADSCERLCCRRGSRQVTIRTEKRCKCKFHWCCEIKCKTCSQEETKYRCR